MRYLLDAWIAVKICTTAENRRQGEKLKKVRLLPAIQPPPLGDFSISFVIVANGILPFDTSSSLKLELVKEI